MTRFRTYGSEPRAVTVLMIALLAGCSDQVTGPGGGVGMVPPAQEPSFPADARWELRADEVLRPGTADALDCFTRVGFSLTPDDAWAERLIVEPIDGGQECITGGGAPVTRAVSIDPSVGRIWTTLVDDREVTVLSLQFAFGEESESLSYEGQLLQGVNMHGSDGTRVWEAERLDDDGVAEAGPPATEPG